MESSTLKKKAKDAFDKTTDYLSDAKDSVTENVGDFVDEAKDNLSKVKDKAKEGINAAGEAVQKAYERPKSNVPALIHVRQGHYVIAGKSGFRCEQ